MLWDELARRCYVSRAWVKTRAYYCLYGGEEDAWLKHIILTELREITHGIR